MPFDPNKLEKIKVKFDPSKLESIKGTEGTQPTSFLEKNASNISNVSRPILEMGGMVTGATLASPGIGTTPIGGALGYATGKTAADLLDRTLGIEKPISNIKEAMKETAGNIVEGLKTESVSLLMNPLFKGIGNMARGAAKKVIGSVFDVEGNALSARYNRPKDIINSKPVDDIASDMSDGLNKISKEVTDLDKKAWDSLLKLKAESRKGIVNMLKSVRREISVEGGGAVGEAAKKAARTIDGLIQDVLSIKQKGVPDKLEHFLDQKQMRKIIQATDDNINWNDPLASRSNEALIEFRTKLSDKLRTENPQYAEIMDPLHKRIQFLNDMAKTFSIAKEEGKFIPSNITATKLGTALKEGKSVSQKLLGTFKSETGKDILKNMEDKKLSEQFLPGEKPFSDRTLRLIGAATVGAGVGGAYGGTPGGLAGTAIGGLIGSIINKQSGPIAGGIVDILRSLPISKTADLINNPSVRRIISSKILSNKY